LRDDHARIRLLFGYRGCFGGSDNDLDLDVSATAATLSGHRWTGPSTNEAADGVALSRADGHAEMRLLVDALTQPAPQPDGWSSTKAFVRFSYWCGTHRAGPFMIETHTIDPENEVVVRNLLHEAPAARPHAASPVHAAIGAARDILASVPSNQMNSPAHLKSERRRRGSLYEGGRRVRHDPVEQWDDSE
jgi:hypothetical protein